MQRYARQTVFSRIGEEGQKKLSQSKVAIIGMGALGTVSANNLCRSGIGYIRMADRDYVELVNLQRQILFNEDDARQNLPKAVAAFNHLSKVNSEITLEPVVTDVNSSNIENLINGVDLVLDATDNWEIRFLLNEACRKHNIPWIYCAALGSYGMTMNILPGEGNPCLRCFISEDRPSQVFSCSTFGVMNMITGAMASVQTMEAVKILLHSDSVRKELFTLDLWENQFDTVNVLKNDDCPVCVHRQYEHLGRAAGSYTTGLCGSNSVQIVPAHPVKIDFSAMAEKLKKAGSVRYNQYTLTFSDAKYEIILFQDGRAMIKNAVDGNNAKSVYTEYIGL
jgi:adenylyltransferase/sulfurtransferase